jgi:hypothetical protein
MQNAIQTGDGLVLEAHPDGPCILLRREGEPDTVRVCLNEVHHLVDAMYTMAADVAGLIVSGGESGSDSEPG